MPAPRSEVALRSNGEQSAPVMGFGRCLSLTTGALVGALPRLSEHPSSVRATHRRRSGHRILK
jgi:hypothetical protein